LPITDLKAQVAVREFRSSRTVPKALTHKGYGGRPRVREVMKGIREHNERTRLNSHDELEDHVQ
jgi:hypothetical protein